MTDVISIMPGNRPSAVGDYAAAVATATGAETIALKGMMFVAPFKLASILDKRPDRAVVIAYTLPHLAAAVKASSLAKTAPRIVYFATDFRPMSTIGVYDSLCRKADAVVVASERQRQLFLNTFGGIGSEKVNVIIPDSPVEPISPATTPRDGLLFCGPLTEESGIGRLVDAMVLDPSKAPRLRVAGTGKGNRVMRLVRESRRLNLPIDWLGEYDRATVIKSASESAAAIYPSTSPEADCYSAAYLHRLLPVIATAESSAATEAILIPEATELTPDILNNLIAKATLPTIKTGSGNADEINHIINSL